MAFMPTWLVIAVATAVSIIAKAVIEEIGKQK